MEQNPTEKQVSPPSELRSLEGGLKDLWERVKQAAELIASLRDEKAALRARNSELEGRLRSIERALAEQQDVVKMLETQQAGSKGDHVLSNGDREALAAKIRDLLAKIDAYL